MNYRIILLLAFVIAVYHIGCAQNQTCLLDAEDYIPSNLNTKSIHQHKLIRINIHFILKSDGTGNFTEVDDGIGGSEYTGYYYAHTITDFMNRRAGWNQKMNLPPNNSTPAIPKKYQYVLDAVYFHRNDDLYIFNMHRRGINIHAQGQDRDSVLNVYFTYHNSSRRRIGGYASSLSPTSRIKFTENKASWQSYVGNLQDGTPIEWSFDATASNLNHELCHLMGLKHTILYNGGKACGSGCSNLSRPLGASDPISMACSDYCDDTPSAEDITALNGCTQHPHCGWWQNIDDRGYDPVYCSNNIMDYSGQNALTPCQINIIHNSLEGGMRSYTTCAAVRNDLYLSDIGHPKVSYFGRRISIGDDAAATADVKDRERLTVYFSASVELENFEVDITDGSFEIRFKDTCSF